MDVLGIGPLELLFVILIALIIIGPKDMTKTARSAGRFLNRMYRSETWRALTQASRTIQTLPNRLAREAELEELEALRKDLDSSVTGGKPTLADNPVMEPWITPYDTPEKFQSIAPPTMNQATTVTKPHPAGKATSAAGKKAGKQSKSKSHKPTSRAPARATPKKRAPKSPGKSAAGKAGAKKTSSRTVSPGKTRSKTHTKGQR